MSAAPRLPDFVIIGTMKSGTTTLFRWLEKHPDVRLPMVKEPDFFSDDRHWQRGIGWYAGHFDGIERGVVTGEASVGYADPRCSVIAARRLHDTLPRARLVCVVRDPVARMRSHYRHEVQRGRERREFSAAISEADSVYVLRSCYASGLRPWVRTFPAEQLHVIATETILAVDDEWRRLLEFLGLSVVARPTSAHNVTADKSNFSPLMLRLWEAGVPQRLPRAPAPVRRMARRLLLRSPVQTAPLVASAQDAVPEAVVARLRQEVVELGQQFPRVTAEWDPSTWRA